MASSIQPTTYPGIDTFLYPGTFKSPTGQFGITLPGTASGGVTVPAPQIGPGNVLYQSELIRQLREANKGPLTNNPGVKLLDNPANSTLVLDFNKPVPKNMANRPEVLKMTPTTPTTPGGDSTGGGASGGGEGGSGGGAGGGLGPIVIGPGGNTLDVDDDKDTEGLDELIADLTKDDDVVDDDKDTEGLDQLIEDLTKDDDVAGDDKDTEGLDQLINDALAKDDASSVPDYTDDLWPPIEVEPDVPDYTDDLWPPIEEDTTNKDASVELKAGDNIVVEGDGIIDFPDTDVVGDVPDYTDDLWGDDVVDVPDYTNDLWGDLGGSDFFDPVYDFDFGWDGFDGGGFSGGGGGGGPGSLLNMFQLV